jgi:hypothetical protein
MKEAPGSSETSVLTRATRRNNPEDTILRVSVSFLYLFIYTALLLNWVGSVSITLNGRLCGLTLKWEMCGKKSAIHYLKFWLRFIGRRRGDEKSVYLHFNQKPPKEIDYLVDLITDGGIIRKLVIEAWCVDVN